MEIDKNTKEIKFFVEGVNVGGFNEQGFGF